MTFLQACEAAAAMRDGCGHHVNARIDPGAFGATESTEGYPHLDTRGYTVSDWCDGTTVRTFVNGREQDGRYVPDRYTGD